MRIHRPVDQRSVLERRVFEHRDYIEPVYLTHQDAYTITTRLAGSAADRHTVLVARSRYDRVGKVMVLSRTTIEHIRQLPSGDLKGLAELIQRLADKAKEATKAMEVELTLDCTRSPLAWTTFGGDPSLFMIATTGLDRFAAPYRYLGRLALLSGMQVALRNSQLVIALPAVSDDARMVTTGKLEKALSNVELKTPKAEGEELLLDDTGPEDDLALVTGLCLFTAAERLVSPEDLRFTKVNREKATSWVV